jgi:hypothetical protein
VSNPYGDESDRPDGIRAWLVVMGAVAGLVVTVVWMTVVFAVAYSFSAEQGRSSTLADVLVFALFIAPLPISVLLLCFRRTRQAAAGFVMGLAVGTLILAGLCGSMLLTSLTA